MLGKRFAASSRRLRSAWNLGSCFNERSRRCSALRNFDSMLEDFVRAIPGSSSGELLVSRKTGSGSEEYCFSGATLDPELVRLYDYHWNYSRTSACLL